jgi:Sec-independent protein translocase protein TatA
VRDKVRSGTGETGDALKRNTARLSFAFGEAVTAFRTALNQPSAEADAESEARTLADQLEQVKERVGKKKKPQGSSQSEPPSHH